MMILSHRNSYRYCTLVKNNIVNRVAQDKADFVIVLLF